MAGGKKQVKNEAGRVRADRKVLLIVVVLPCIALATWFLFTSPKQQAEAEVSAQLEAINSQTAAYSQKIDSLNSGQTKNAAAYLATAAKLDRQLPAAMGPVEAISAVQRLAQQTSVTVDDVGSDVAAGSPNAKSVKTTISGAPQNVIRFLVSIQDYEPLVTVTDLTLTYATSDKGALTATAGMTLLLWHYPAPDLANDPDVQAMVPSGEKLPDPATVLGTAEAGSSTSPTPQPSAPAPVASTDTQGSPLAPTGPDNPLAPAQQ